MSLSLFILSLLLQLGLLVHCVRTGRNTLWIWMILIGSLVGALAYIVVELLPEMLGSRATRRAVRSMRSALNPQRELRQLKDRASIGGGIDAQQRYAEELLRQGQPGEAAEVYARVLTGLYEQDPNLLLGLARAQFAAAQPAAARVTLDRLRQHNPDFNSAEGHLLYARVLADSGDRKQALEEFAALSAYYPGAEARVRHAQLLRAEGHAAEARQVLTELLDSARIAPAHYRRAQSEWLATAEQELQTLNSA